MGSALIQASHSQWKPGLSRPIATLRVSPEALERSLRLKFEEDEDDLDRFKVACVRTPDGNEFALVRYLHSPNADTEIWTKSSSRRPALDLGRALKALGLGREVVSWTLPEVSGKPSVRDAVGKSKRTTHRSFAGKLLYAVRDTKGRFKDIQTDERAHRADVSKKSKKAVVKKGRSGRGRG